MAQRIKQMISFKRKCSFIVLISDVNIRIIQHTMNWCIIHIIMMIVRQ